MDEKGTGIFGTIERDEIQNSAIDLVTVSEGNLDSIYNLLFEKYDEEKDE